MTSREFSTYRFSLEMVTSFKYLGRLLSVADDGWPVVVQNLVKAQTVWQRMSKILIREGARPRVSIFLFKYVVQSVLLFVSETWLVTPCMGRAWGGSSTKWQGD